MPIFDPGFDQSDPATYYLLLTPGSASLPGRYPVEGAYVEAGASDPGPEVEVFRIELRFGNFACIGLNCRLIDGGNGKTIEAIPQLSNDGMSWRNVATSGSPAIIVFSTTPGTPLKSVGLGYTQAFVGRTLIPVNPEGSFNFVVPVGARFFRVVLRSPAHGASGVFDAVGAATFFAGIG